MVAQIINWQTQRETARNWKPSTPSKPTMAYTSTFVIVVLSIQDLTKTDNSLSISRLHRNSKRPTTVNTHGSTMPSMFARQLLVNLVALH